MKHKLDLTKKQMAHIAHLMDNINGGSRVTIQDVLVRGTNCYAVEHFADFVVGRITSLDSDGHAEIAACFNLAMDIAGARQMAEAAEDHVFNYGRADSYIGKLMSTIVDIKQSLRLEVGIGIATDADEEFSEKEVGG